MWSQDQTTQKSRSSPITLDAACKPSIPSTERIFFLLRSFQVRATWIGSWVARLMDRYLELRIYSTNLSDSALAYGCNWCIALSHRWYWQTLQEVSLDDCIGIEDVRIASLYSATTSKHEPLQHPYKSHWFILPFSFIFTYNSVYILIGFIYVCLCDIFRALTACHHSPYCFFSCGEDGRCCLFDLRSHQQSFSSSSSNFNELRNTRYPWSC